MWSPAPESSSASELRRVADVLDPVLAPLGFAPGQGGVSDAHAQMIFCRGDTHSTDGGCVDLVIDLQAAPEWRITDVRYWGFASEKWHLEFNSDEGLDQQLTALARTLPATLGSHGELC